MNPLVGVLIGSENDREVIAPALQVLDEYQVPHELAVMSAHRNAEKVRAYALSAEQRGLQVLIAAAGFAAHLPGVLASWSMLPVIGIPVPASDLKGVDSLLSIAQMPGGIPVTCVGIGKSGAKNAALAAVQILALHDDRLRALYRAYRERLASQ
ncbi:MAG: 5-(carboxyamino)imidazole ribonucleotide mutase [Dehalococcoidia bacterium]|nr:MAG: 5-(carboxyamino)imidazole ribonucleotide mutase [Dehalococcoidia bacterium]